MSRGWRIVLYVLGGLLAVALIFVGWVAYAFMQAFVVTDQRYISPIATEADVGAVRIPIDYCQSERPMCSGYMKFFRGSRLLVVHGQSYVSGYDTETGRQLWRIDRALMENATIPPVLTEFDDGEYAFSSGGGQIIDLDDGRIAFVGGLYDDTFAHGSERQIRKLRRGIYRLPYYQGTYIVDLDAGRMLPYASRDAGVSDSFERFSRSENEMAPYHGPADQTDDGALAVWLSALHEPRGPYQVSVHSRTPTREVWRVTLPFADYQHPRAWIEGRVVHVEAAWRRLDYDLRTGAPRGEHPVERSELELAPRQPRPDLGQCRAERCHPGDWTELDVWASDDRSVVAIYEVQTPPGGNRVHSGHFTGSALESGPRRLRVSRGIHGPTLLLRALETGRTTTRGYLPALALSADGSKVAVMPTDGVVRVYSVPRTATE